MPEWPAGGVAIEGDFSGIQHFVLRPVPGAKGAARRLRARSFRVLALTRLIAEAVLERFHQENARLFYSAGGRFLVVMRISSNWRATLCVLQQEIDDDLLKSDQGELAFHLAGAEFQDGKIPVAELHEQMRLRKLTPLSGALCGTHGWATECFTFRSVQPAKCDGCGATAALADKAENLCATCVSDRELGKELLGASRATLKRSSSGAIALLGQYWSAVADGPIPISFVSHTPLAGDQLATFEQLSSRAAGRPYLAYLRVDADRAGEEFRKLAGDPVGVWDLSNRLNSLFSDGVSALLQGRFQSVYPVYGGGDDLFVIGPWNEILDFAAALRSQFQSTFGGRLTISAGISLAKPRQHILTKSDEADYALHECAKVPRDSICALGSTTPFSDFEDVLGNAREFAALTLDGHIKHALLHNIVGLHDRWQRCESDNNERQGEVTSVRTASGQGSNRNSSERDALWRALLFYQLERNVDGRAKNFVANAFLKPGRLWVHAGFVARYAMLRTGGEEKA